MNYYPFHIGDYASATRHLSWDEDCAYRRLLDLCYTSEKPVPLDRKRVYRLVMAQSKPQRLAVDAVLTEFFHETPEGFVQERVQEELASMLEKSAASEQRDDHERERMRRYRERRSQMFAGLRLVGIVPAWDIPMRELQQLYDENCNGAETYLQREQVVSGDDPATAIPTPTPTPTPTPSKNPSGSGADKPAKRIKGARRVPDEFEVTPDMEAWVTESAPAVDWRRETEKFRDWEFKHPRSDWPATWRTWMRKAQEDKESRTPAGRTASGVAL